MSAFPEWLVNGLIMLAIATIFDAARLTVVKPLVKAWVWVYTLGLAPETQLRRRLEMESELWEHEQDAKSVGHTLRVIALLIAARSLLGVPADLSWRLTVDGGVYGTIFKRWLDLALAAAMLL